MAMASARASPEVSLASIPPDKTVLRLPHPHHTEFTLEPSPDETLEKVPLYCIRQRPGSAQVSHPCDLVSANIFFSEPTRLRSGEQPPADDNSAWARARRSPGSVVVWRNSNAAPSPAQAWLLLYLFWTLRPGCESIRLHFRGPGAATLARQLIDLLLAAHHVPDDRCASLNPESTIGDDAHVVAWQGTFWQGAGCPFGPRPVWLPEGLPKSLLPSPSGSTTRPYPPTPIQNTLTVAPAGNPHDPGRLQLSHHPLRPPKPAPGAVIYSRWIPHIGETFSMVALDWQSAEHLDLVHSWMNDPRVSEGWNEQGTLEHHRNYLRAIDEDPHQIAVLGRWDDVFFGYFEFYWAKEDRLGAFSDVGDFDRGRHSLVGDVRFRGPHRVSGWWSSQIHYLFLDDPRTMCVVGEPKVSNTTSSMYDLMHGFHIGAHVDLPHKRSTHNQCPRVKFFQLCPMAEQERVVAGLKMLLGPKL